MIAKRSKNILWTLILQPVATLVCRPISSRKTLPLPGPAAAAAAAGYEGLEFRSEAASWLGH